jgi:hypothetical protein
VDVPLFFVLTEICQNLLIETERWTPDNLRPGASARSRARRRSTPDYLRAQARVGEQLCFFFVLNKLGQQLGPVLALMWLEDGRSGIASMPRERAALEAGGAAPQTPSAPRRAGGAVDLGWAWLASPVPRRSPSWATGRAGSIFFFDFCERSIRSARSAREEHHVHSRRQEEDQTGIK